MACNVYSGEVITRNPTWNNLGVLQASIVNLNLKPDRTRIEVFQH